MPLPVHVSSLSGDTLAWFDAYPTWRVEDLLKRLLDAGEFRICTLVHCEHVLHVASTVMEAGFTEDVNRVVAIFKTRHWFDDAGISMGTLMSADADAAASRREHNLKSAGYTARELRTIGCTATELRETLGLPPQQTARALKDAGFSFREMLDAGYAARKLREIGFPLSSFEGCSDEELVQAGFTLVELYQGGRNLSQLLGAGFTVKDLEQAGFTAGHLYERGWTLLQLRGLGLDAKQLKQLGPSAAELAAIGYTAQQLKHCFSLVQLKRAGFGPAELRDAGYSAWVLAKSGFRVSELCDAGFSVQELAEAGYVLGGASSEKGACTAACASRRRPTLPTAGIQ